MPCSAGVHEADFLSVSNRFANAPSANRSGWSAWAVPEPGLEVLDETELGDPIRRIRLQRLADLGVQVRRDPPAGMVQPVLHDLHGYSRLERQRRPAVAKVVKIDDGERSTRVLSVVSGL